MKKDRCETCKCYDCDCEECNCECHKDKPAEMQLELDFIWQNFQKL